MTKQRDLALPAAPRGSDSLKAGLAARIQRKVLSWAANGNLLQGVPLPYGITSMEATSPDWLTTEIRVVTDRGGVRRFTVKITENW